MKRSGIRKNNRGDSLILVIGCIALLSIVGVILLAKTMDNRNMKVAEEQGQASFTEAESGSAEMVTVIENIAYEVVEDAFGDMMIEFTVPQGVGEDGVTPITPKQRFNEYFSKKVKQKLESAVFAEELKAALDVTELTNLTVSCGTVGIEGTATNAYTQTVRVEDVVFSYTSAGSQTTITTDICVKAKIPDVEHGFNTGISCDFADFAIVTDGTAKVTTEQGVYVNGNMYVGTDFVTSGSEAGATVQTNVSGARKLLVKNQFLVENNAQVYVNNGSLSFLDGEGIWADDIVVKKGLLDTENVNVYVADDLAVEGKVAAGATIQTKVEMSGNSSEYIGFSGNTTASENHEKSSALTINEVNNLTLDLSGLGKVYINGNSYICEDNSKWGGWDSGTSAITAAEGILQGETVAYKDMQAMYLFPGVCLPQGHNPIIGENASVGSPTTLLYSFWSEDKGTETLDLSAYVDTTNPFVTRTAVLDGGATKATYVYLNFASPAKAAQYVRDYLETAKGESIKSQIANMGSSTIKLPINLPEQTKTITLGNAITYIGGNLEMLPSATSLQIPTLSSACLLAKQRYRGLFSTLRAEAGAHVADDYKMAAQGIVYVKGIEDTMAVGEEKNVMMTDPVTATNTYNFYVHYGDLTIDGSTDSEKYKNMKGILLVHGNLNISRSNTNIEGLVLATGNITVTQGATITANATAVETLLTNDDVAKYFRVYGDTSGNGYLSTESVEISFDNWKKN